MTSAGSHEAPTPRRGRPPSGGREAILSATVDVLRERGAGRLTTREIAARAGVSEGSVFYHFTDRSGLMTAAIENCLQLLDDPVAKGVAAPDAQPDAPPDCAPADPVVETLDRFSEAIEAFLEQGLTVIVAAQSETGLRDELADYMHAHDLGPHRGVEALGAFLRQQQAAGRVRADVDTEAVAMLLLGSCFLRVAQRQMIDGPGCARMPTRADVVATTAALLRPEPAAD
jgi:AcrR family transcriptional regulator